MKNKEEITNEINKMMENIKKTDDKSLHFYLLGKISALTWIINDDEPLRKLLKYFKELNIQEIVSVLENIDSNPIDYM